MYVCKRCGSGKFTTSNYESQTLVIHNQSCKKCGGVVYTKQEYLLENLMVSLEAAKETIIKIENIIENLLDERTNYSKDWWVD